MVQLDGRFNGGQTSSAPNHPAPQAPKNRFANEIADRLGMLIQRLASNNERLEMALERSFGASASKGNGAIAETPVPINHVNLIAVQLTTLDNMLSEQGIKLNKLEEMV